VQCRMTSLIKFNGKSPAVFNYKYVIQPENISMLKTEEISSGSISSETIKSKIMSVVGELGEDLVVTNAELNLAIVNAKNDVKNDILGPGVSSSMNTLREIELALSSDPNAYASLVTSIATKAPIANPTFTGTVAGISKAMIGLSNVDNTSDASKPVSTATQTALDLKANLASPTFTGTVTGISKAMVGLSNVDNTADTAKPVSTAQQTALDLKANQSSLDTTNTNVTNLQNKTSSLSYNSGTNTLTVQSKLICALDESSNGNTTIGDASTDTLTINSTTSFAAPVTGLTKSTVGLANVDNTSDANKPVSTAQQTALNLKANLASPTFTGTVSGISKTMVGLGNVDNTADSAKPISTATQTALDLKANQSSLDTTNTNVTALQNKTSSLSYNSGTNTLTVQSKLVCALDESSNATTTIGDASSDILTIYATPTFNNGLTVASGSVSFPSASIAQSSINGLSTALAAKAADSAVCHNSGTETWVGTKTFSSSPIVPTPTANDNSTKVCSTAYCDSAVSTAVANLINAAPSALDTLNELASAMGNDANFSTTVTNSLAGKASLTSNNTYTGNQIYNTGSSTFNNGLSANTITLNGANLNTRIGNIETKSDKLVYDGPSDTLSINAKVSVAKDVSDIGSIYLGDGVGNDIIYVRGNINSNSQMVTPAQLGYLSGATSSIQSQLSGKANLASPTFTGTVSGITKTMVGLSNVDNTADTAKPVSTAQQTALDLKANLASPTFTGTVSGITKTMVGLGNVDNTADTGKPVSTAQQTALDLKANIASPTFTGTVSGITKAMVGLSNVDDTSDTGKPVSTAQQTALDLKAGLSSTQTFSGVNTFSSYNYVNEIAEIVNSVTGVTTSCSLDYTTCKGINYIQTPSANFSLALTNLPSPINSNKTVYTITLMMAVKYYCNSITVNSTSRTLYFSGGASNVSIHASAAYVIQQINICYLNSATPVVTSCVQSLW
jgi:hypothetical protein